GHSLCFTQLAQRSTQPGQIARGIRQSSSVAQGPGGGSTGGAPAIPSSPPLPGGTPPELGAPPLLAPPVSLPPAAICGVPPASDPPPGAPPVPPPTPGGVPPLAEMTRSRNIESLPHPGIDEARTARPARRRPDFEARTLSAPYHGQTRGARISMGTV